MEYISQKRGGKCLMSSNIVSYTATEHKKMVGGKEITVRNLKPVFTNDEERQRVNSISRTDYIMYFQSLWVEESGPLRYNITVGGSFCRKERADAEI